MSNGEHKTVRPLGSPDQSDTTVARVESSVVRQFFASLRRRTSTGLYMPELDGLRFVAIASVFLYHLAGDIQRHGPSGASYHSSLLFQLTQKMNVGVSLFFAISGMILSLPFASHLLAGKDPVRLSTYFLRRLTRLEPPYVATLLLFFAFKILSARAPPETLLAHLFSSILYVHNLVYQQPSTINFVAWSLEVEIQFYISVPILTLIFAVRPVAIRRTVLCCMVLAFSALSLLPTFDRLFHLTVIGNAQYFLVGFIMTDMYLAGALSQSTGRHWDAVSLVGWPLAGLGLIFGREGFLLLLPFMILLLCAAAFKGNTSRRVFRNLVLVSVGGMCYSIYLVHNYVIAATGLLTERILVDADFPTRLLAQTTLQVWPVFIAGLVLYKFIEQPCMNSRWPARLVLKVKTML